MKKIILSIAFLYISIAVMAYDINGVVVNTNTNAPMSNAVIMLYQNNEVVSSVTSNFSGQFTLKLNKDNVYKLEVVKDGYKTENAELNVTQEFVEAMPTLTVKLTPLDFNPSFSDMKNGMKESVSDELMEDIGLIDSLPEGYKIIEAIPLKTKKEEKSRFNVATNQSNYQYTNVNVEVLKEEFNKENVVEAIYANDILPSSFYAEGEILYGEGKTLLTDDIEEMLISVAEKLKNEPTTSLKIIAYADAAREANIGEYISKLRVEEVTNFLVKQEVPFEQLEVVITGNKYLENGCYRDVRCDDYQHQENRRVVLELIK